MARAGAAHKRVNGRLRRRGAFKKAPVREVLAWPASECLAFGPYPQVERIARSKNQIWSRLLAVRDAPVTMILP